MVPAAVHAVVDEDDVEDHDEDPEHQLCYSHPVKKDLHLPLSEELGKHLEILGLLPPGPLLLPHQGYGEDCVVISLEVVLAVMNLVVHCF